MISMRASLCILAIGCWLTVCAVSEAQLNEGLIGHWTLDDATGDTATDQGGNGLDGTIEGDGTWVAGIWDGALDFTRDAETKVIIPGAGALDLTETITLAAWVRPRSVYVGAAWQERNCIVAKVRAYYLDISELGLLSSYIYGPQPQQWVSGTTDLSGRVDEWFHVATTYDGSEHVVYLDGKVEAQLARQGAIQVAATDLFIGYVDNQRYFDGVIDDVRLYDRALKPQEITEMVQTGLSVAAQGKLPMLWAFLKR